MSCTLHCTAALLKAMRVTPADLPPPAPAGNLVLRPAVFHSWLSRTPAERIAAVEALRQQYVAQHFDAEPRLQRVCRVTQLRRG